MNEAHFDREEHLEIKVVGKSGQISLGKSYAGKIFRLQRRDDGDYRANCGRYGARKPTMDAWKSHTVRASSEVSPGLSGRRR